MRNNAKPNFLKKFAEWLSLIFDPGILIVPIAFVVTFHNSDNLIGSAGWVLLLLLSTALPIVK